MEKRSIIGITLIVGMAIVFLLLTWGLNSILLGAETNPTKQPVLSSEEHPNQVLGGLSHSMVLEKTLPDKVEKVMVYKVVPPRFTRQDIISLGKKFNIDSLNHMKEGDEGFSIGADDGSAYVLLTNNGWIEYTNRTRANTVNPFDVPTNLPSDDEAEKIATKFLKDRALLPEGATFIKTTHGKILGTAKNGTDIVFWEDVQVWYGHKLSGYTIEGTQLMLAIGGRGDPIEFFTNWRNYEPYKELPIKTPELAFEELKTKGVAVGVNNLDKVSINEVYLAYHTKPGAETEEYLEPVWVFKGNVLADGKSVDSVEEYVPALSNESIRSLSQ